MKVGFIIGIGFFLILILVLILKGKKKDSVPDNRLKILLVDDNEVNNKVTARVLSQYNFNIICVNSLQTCLDNIKLGEKYEFIFVDYTMPGMSGKEVLNQLKSLGVTVPIIALIAQNEDRNVVINDGFNDVLVKPVNQSDVDRIIGNNKGI